MSTEVRQTCFYSCFIIRRRWIKAEPRPAERGCSMFSLFTHQWRLPVAKRLKLRHRGLTFITRGSFVFLAVRCEKAFYWLSQNRGSGIRKHAQALKRHGCVSNLCGIRENPLLDVNAGYDLNDRFLPLLIFFFRCHRSSLRPLQLCTLQMCACVLCVHAVCLWADVRLYASTNLMHIHFTRANCVCIYWLGLHYRELTEWITYALAVLIKTACTQSDGAAMVRL